MKKYLFCEKCGNLKEYGQEDMCCSEQMHIIKPNSQDAAQEKHVPVVEKNDRQIKVTVGSIEHPMSEEHYIKYIIIKTNRRFKKVTLTPKDCPQCIIDIEKDEQIENAFAYCNLHGLWMNEKTS